MLTDQQVIITSKSQNSRQRLMLIQQLYHSAEEILAGQITEIGEQYRYVTYIHDKRSCRIHFGIKQNDSVYITIVICPTLGCLDMPTQNVIVKKFGLDLRSKSKGMDINVYMPQCDINLKDIIKGNVVRGYFDRFSSSTPLTRHRLDLERFDHFICSVHRFAPNDINAYLLERYMCEVLSWPVDDAQFYIKRLHTGLDVLKQNQRFGYYA